MRTSRFTEQEQREIVGEQKHGLPAKEICRRHGISLPTFYKWRARFGGEGASEASQIRALQTENDRLKRALAHAVLDAEVLREVLGKS